MAAIHPADTRQLAECIQVLDRHKLSIVPRGSGTGVAGGAVAFDGGVLVSSSRMNRIESIDLPNRVAVVQAGVRNTALSAAVAASGYTFSPDPSSQNASTIGGNVATNAGGVNTLKRGATTNHVLGVEMVCAGGRIAKTRCGALLDGFGPDVPALICGSEGTLGLISRVWCRLTPAPRSLRTVYAIFPAIDAACQTVSAIVSAGIVPAALEVVDRGIIEALRAACGIGFPADARAMLLIEIEGIDAVLDDELADVLRVCQDNQVLDVRHCSTPQDRGELWRARKQAAGAIGHISRSYCVQDACVPRSRLAEVMRNIMDMGHKSGIRITNVFHAGDGNIHPLLLFDEDDAEQVQRVLDLSRQILEYCVDVGGTITGEHGVGVEKTHLMPRMFNAATLDAFARIKQCLDPDRRINDGKAIPSPRIQIDLLRPAAPNLPAGALAS